MSDNGIREQLLEALPDAVFVVAGDGRIVFVNAQAVALFGYALEDLVGQPIEMLVPDTARSIHPTHRSRYFNAPQVRPMGAGLDLSGRKADGTEFPAEISLSAIETADGRLVTAVVRDVTERMKTQTKFQGLLEAAPDAMVGVDSQGLIRLVNSQTERLFGYHRSELLGERIEILVPPRARSVHPAHRQRYFADPRVRPMGAGNELFGIRKDGSEFPAEISLSSIDTEDGILVTAAVRDVSERKTFELVVERARDTAERAAQARQDFLANMSHEIRTPMNAVIGITSLLLDTHLDAQQRDYVETVRSSGDHLLTIISDILDYAKIDSGKIALEDVEFRLLDWVEDTVDLVAPQATDRGLELVVDVSAEVPSVVRGDPGRLRQVLINVLSNALKFTPSGEVVVRVTAEPIGRVRSRVRVEVRDTGIGITTERLAVLFDPFTQADTTTTREYGGTGLGLAISKRLTELMGGTIELTSTVGTGTSAVFTFVARVVAPAAPATPLHTERELLVVDDNATSRQVLAAWARRQGFHVSTAGSAEEALAVAATLGTSFGALVDHTLPGTDGMRLGRHLRGAHPGARLVLLSPAALSSSNRSSSVYDAVVTKPVKRSHVERALLALMGSAAGIRVARPSSARPSPFELTSRVPLSILVVEDNPVNQKVARHMLARFGYRADVAWSGGEALEMLARRSYDLVLMDVQMPGMDGLETTRRIRARYPMSGPRVVAMTANVSRASITSCLTAGMDSFLGKPVVVTELAAVLEDLAATRGGSVPIDHRSIDVLDASVLIKLGGQIGRGTVQELVAMFRDDVARSGPQLTASATAGDHAQVAGLAHRLRSASRTLGANHLADMLGALEERAPQDTDLPALVAAVVDEMRLVVTELDAVAAQGAESPR
jgi:two-component system sensor histidine kinase/response regulator